MNWLKHYAPKHCAPTFEEVRRLGSSAHEDGSSKAMADADDASRHTPTLYITHQPRDGMRPIHAVVFIMQVRTQYNRARLHRRRGMAMATVRAVRAEACHARE